MHSEGHAVTGDRAWRNDYTSERAWYACLAAAFPGLTLVETAPPASSAGVLLAPTPVALPAVRAVAAPKRPYIDLCDVVLPPGDAPQPLVDLVRRAHAQLPFDVLIVPRVRSRSHLLRALPASGLSYALSDEGASAYCDVTRPDALKALSKSTLHNFDRSRRRAEREFGPVVMERVRAADQLLPAAFERFLAIESAGWKGATGSGTALALDLPAQAFLRDVVTRFAGNDGARIDFLTIAGRDAAAQLMVRSGRTWFLLKIGYHPDFRAVGPGGILLKMFLEEAVSAPDIDEVNLSTSPPWADRWHFQTEPVFRVNIYNTTARGRALYAARQLKELAKRARHALRAAHERPSSEPQS